MLLAGTSAGLYWLQPGSDRWRPVSHPELCNREIVDIARAGRCVYVFTRENGYVANIRLGAPEFTRISLTTVDTVPGRTPLLRLLLKIHDGSLLGLPGRLLVDCLGAALLLLSISGCYVWFVPSGRRKFKFGKKPQFFRVFHKYHLLVGISSALFLILISLSGILVRPPFLPIIRKITVPGQYDPGHLQSGDWRHGRIQKALYLEQNDQLLLATTSGFFAGPAGLAITLKKIPASVPMHGMGAFVLETMGKGKIVVGSFKGAYIWDMATNHVEPAEKLLPGAGGQHSQNYKISGVITQNSRPIRLADYRLGLLPAEGQTDLIRMPPAVADRPMSLFHFLFECHNGRIFRGLLGKYTWLLIPAGGVSLLMVVVTGCYDWFFKKTVRKFV
jgi:hypothetical protein